MSTATVEPSTLASLVATYYGKDAHASQSSVLAIVTELVRTKVQGIKDLVELLGPQLTSTETPQRVKGMTLLATLVTELASRMAGTFTSSTAPAGAAKEGSQETEVVSTFAEFFLARLDDDATMVESLEALFALVATGRLSRRLCELILKKLYCDISVHLQSSPQLVRRGAYWVLKCMLEDEVGGGNAAVRHLGEELVGGFVSAMDGEKEPRNLLIALMIFPRLAWTVQQHVSHLEDLFEISSCYFPISFSERSDDPNAIRKAHLISALRRTMCTGTDHWIPFLLEKLASSLIETKLEVLHALHHALTWTISLRPTLETAPSTFSLHTPISSTALEACFKPFKIPQLGTLFWRFDQVQPFVSALANALIKEVINTTDEQVAQNATNVITDLTSFLTNSSNGSLQSNPCPESRFKALLQLTDAVFKQCLPHLGMSDAKDASRRAVQVIPDSKLATMASKIISAVTCGSAEAAHVVLKRLVPNLEAKWLQSPSDRSFVLRQFLNLSKATSVFAIGEEKEETKTGTESCDDFQSPFSAHPLNDYSTPMVRILLSCCVEEASHAQDQADAMEALAIISTIQSGALLPVSSWTQILSTFYQKLLQHSHVESNSIASIGLKVASIKAILRFQATHASYIRENDPMQVIWKDFAERLDAVHKAPEERNYQDVAELVAALHLLCDPSAMPSSHEEDSPAEAFVHSAIVTEMIQTQFIQALRRENTDSRIFSILLSSLSRTASSTTQFNLVYAMVATHLSTHQEGDKHWRQAVLKWLPRLTQRIASTALPSSSDQIKFFENLYNVVMNGNMQDILGNESVQVPGDANKFVTELLAPLSISSLCAVVTSLPLNNLISKDDPTLQSELEVQQGLTLSGKIFKLLSRLHTEILSKASTGENAENSIGSANRLATTEHEGLEERQAEDWMIEAVASVLNKLTHPACVLDCFVEKKLVLSELLSAQTSLKAERPLQLFVWSAKALCQRNHKLGLQMVSALVSMLKSSETDAVVKHLIAEQMEILLRVVSTSVLPVCACLYKQKVWNVFLPLLTVDYKSADGAQQSVYMQALSGLLKHLPRGVLLQNAPQILPILLTGLKRRGEAVCAQSVASLFNMLHADASPVATQSTQHSNANPSGTPSQDVLALLEAHLGSVIPPLVHISSSASPTPKKSVFLLSAEESQRMLLDPSARCGCSASTRLLAVESLRTLLKLPYVKIIPWRNIVVDGLQPALDDPKRLIRKQVVATRNEWFLVKQQ